MNIARLMVHDVTVVSPGTTTDEYGGTVDNWATTTRTDTKAWITQLQGEEATVDRDTQAADWEASLPVGTVITGDDRLEWGSLVFEVVGPPARAWTPQGEHHVVARLRTRVSG